MVVQVFLHLLPAVSLVADLSAFDADGHQRMRAVLRAQRGQFLTQCVPHGFRRTPTTAFLAQTQGVIDGGQQLAEVMLENAFVDAASGQCDLRAQ